MKVTYQLSIVCKKRIFPKFNIIRNTKYSIVYFLPEGMFGIGMGALIICAQSVVNSSLG